MTRPVAAGNWEVRMKMNWFLKSAISGLATICLVPSLWAGVPTLAQASLLLQVSLATQAQDSSKPESLIQARRLAAA
jgi:hypothetical protein